MLPVALIALVACGREAEDPHAAEIAALQARVEALEAELSEARDRLDALQAEVSEVGAYTDEMAVAAVQNDDPTADPDRANLRYLWSSTDYGWLWLADSRWTLDNRSDPPGADPRHELMQLFHETPECEDGDTFDDCNSTAAVKIYVNGPTVDDNDWSEAGFADRAGRRIHTHASGLYVVSFGQAAIPSDYGYAIIPPSGVHLEPHGAHQGLRVDGSENSGENVRIDLAPGSTGIAIYEGSEAASTCAELRDDCETAWPLYLRGGRLHFEDIQVERSATDARGAGVATLHETSFGVEPFYSWHVDAETGLPVHCVWNTTVSAESVVRLSPYTTSPDLPVAHGFALVDTWGPGEAPADCTGTQLIKTDAAGVYGYAFPSDLTAEGGFSVAILGPDPTPLDPGEWRETDRPSFVYEVIDPL